MSRGLRIGVAAALIAALAAAVLLLGRGDNGPGTAPRGTSEDERVEQLDPAEAITLERRRRARQQRRELRAEDPAAEAGPPPLYERQIAAETPAALQIVRRFQRAFSRYELGELAPAVASQLRATTTRQLGRELLAAPPRIPPAAERPTRARLGRLQFVPLGGERPSRRLQRAQLVGALVRGDRRKPISFELERDPEGGGWLLSGLGR